MPIQVICPGCHARFKVSDKFAGKEGPCPKCKTVMKIPTAQEQVVIHAPEEFGPKNAAGRAVLKPLERQETHVTPVQWVAIGSAVILVPLLAWILGRVFREGDTPQVPMVVLALGALILAPPLVVAGYAFLRNDELEPYRGTELLVRAGICSVVYAAVWGLYAVLAYYLFPGTQPELWHLVFLVPMLFVPGTLASLATLDLDATNAAIHFGFYFGTTIILRLIMGLSAF